MKKGTFRFDPINHEYSVDSIRIPSVSEVLQESGLVTYKGVGSGILRRAKLFGIAVHRATYLYDKNDLDKDSLDEAVLPFLEDWIKLVSDYKLKPILREDPICSYLYRFGAKPDFVGNTKGKIAVVDIKATTKVEPGVYIQTAAYRHAASEWLKKKIKYRYIAHLKGDGKPDLIPCENRLDENAFLSALTVVNAKRYYKIK